MQGKLKTMMRVGLLDFKIGKKSMKSILFFTQAWFWVKICLSKSYESF